MTKPNALKKCPLCGGWPLIDGPFSREWNLEHTCMNFRLFLCFYDAGVLAEKWNKITEVVNAKTE